MGDPSWAIYPAGGHASLFFSSYTDPVSNQGVQVARLALADLDAPVEKRGVGGLGNLLVGRLVDVSDYLRTGSSNVLTLRFRRDASPR